MKNASNPHFFQYLLLKNIIVNPIFLKKMIFSKMPPSFVQLVGIWDLFRFFYNKITIVYRIFLKKKKKDTSGKKSEKIVNGNLQRYIDLFCVFFPKPLLQNHDQYPIFCIFFSTTKVYRSFLQKISLLCQENTAKIRFFPLLFHFFCQKYTSKSTCYIFVKIVLVNTILIFSKT